jgi:hypothetical protein
MKIASIHSQKCTLCGKYTTWGAWSWFYGEREPLCRKCIEDQRGFDVVLEFESRSEKAEFYREGEVEGEKQYLVSKCNGHPDHFYIQAFNGDEATGAIMSIFNADLAYTVNDLDQQNFSKDVGGGE